MTTILSRKGYPDRIEEQDGSVIFLDPVTHHQLPIIYTIGNKASYLHSFQDTSRAQPPMKSGRDGEYPGGSVWFTYQEALRMALRRSQETGQVYAVFGVRASWFFDTVPTKAIGDHVDWHDLIQDSPLVLLEP